jgi:hypothetical protein
MASITGRKPARLPSHVAKSTRRNVCTDADAGVRLLYDAARRAAYYHAPVRERE